MTKKNTLFSMLNKIKKEKHYHFLENFHFRLTNRCNLKCSMCDIWKKESTLELTIEQWKKIIKKLHNWTGPFKVDFAGGEIFLYEGFFELVKFCKKLGCQTTVTTNGTLITPTVAKNVIVSGLDTVNFSVDTLNLKKYIYLRKKDTLKEVIQGLTLIKNLRFKKHFPTLSIACIIIQQNIDELVELIQFSKEKADCINFQVIDHNFGRDYVSNWYKGNKFWPKNIDKTLTVLNKIIDIKKAGYPISNSIKQLITFKEYFKNTQIFIEEYICQSGKKNFIIDANGDVLLCWNMPPVGNILEEGPESIWNNKLSTQTKKDIIRCKRTCKILNCNYQ